MSAYRPLLQHLLLSLGAGELDIQKDRVE